MLSNPRYCWLKWDYLTGIFGCYKWLLIAIFGIMININNIQISSNENNIAYNEVQNCTYIKHNEYILLHFKTPGYYFE